MTSEQITMLISYAEGAYSQMKTNESTDIVWTDMLKSYEYKGIMQALKNHIKSNRFPPSPGDLIRGYESILSTFDRDIIDMMARDGVFDDEEEGDVADWNKRSRRAKTEFFISNDIMPDWLKKIYEHYRAKIRSKYFAPNNQRQIEGSG